MSKNTVTEGQIFALLASSPELLSDLLKNKSVEELQAYAQEKAAETLIGGVVETIEKKFYDDSNDDSRREFVGELFAIAARVLDMIVTNTEKNRGKDQKRVGIETPHGYLTVSLLGDFVE